MKGEIVDYMLDVIAWIIIATQIMFAITLIHFGLSALWGFSANIFLFKVISTAEFASILLLVFYKLIDSK